MGAPLGFELPFFLLFPHQSRAVSIQLELHPKTPLDITRNPPWHKSFTLTPPLLLPLLRYAFELRRAILAELAREAEERRLMAMEEIRYVRHDPVP